MTPAIQAGSILIEDQKLRAQVLGLECESYFSGWGVIKNLDSFALDQKVHAAGWNFFFIADEVKVAFFGAVASGRIQNAVKRLLAKVKHQNYNCLEVTEIVAKRFMGFPYSIVSAHSRHIQQSWQLDSAEGRCALHNHAEWARG